MVYEAWNQVLHENQDQTGIKIDFRNGTYVWKNFYQWKSTIQAEVEGGWYPEDWLVQKFYDMLVLYGLMNPDQVEWHFYTSFRRYLVHYLKTNFKRFL